MSNKELKSIIESILIEKKEQLVSRLNSAQSNILNEIQTLSSLDNFSDFSLPDDIGLASKTGNEVDINHLHKYSKVITSANNQLQLINNLLEGINVFCSRAALFLLRDDKLVGWNGIGFSSKNGEIGDKEIKKIFFSLSADTIFKKVLNNKKPYQGKPSPQPDDHLIYSRFGGNKPDSIFVLPFFVKGKPQAVIYTDSTGGQIIGTKQIEIISTIGEMSLDLLPLRQKMLARVKTQEYIEESDEQSAEHVLDEPIPDQIPKSIRKNDPQRKARVIINDMILYNQKLVEDALADNNLYGAMKDTIAQAKDEFLRKFSDLSIFETQLIQILAKGNKEALKGYKFETL